MGLRILTFSDIHYKTEYDLDNDVKNYFESFFKKVKEIHAATPIDIIVISGDLAFSGTNEQYKLLAKKLKRLGLKIPIAAIVGNHDVDWGNIKAAIGDRELEEIFSVKESTIIADVNSSNSKYKKVFEDFRVSFLEEINDDLPSGYNSDYCPKTYTGYWWLPGSETILVLLNSSWFSFGPGVIEEYYKEKIKNLDDKHLREGMKSFLGDALSQEGKQSYFFTSYPFYDKIYKIIEKHPNAKVVTFAHHPPNWLKWEEQFLETDDKKRNLDEVLALSDLLVTGHLHNPVLPPSVINGQCYHVSNGAFLDYHFVDQKSVINPISKFPNNWFNIIDIEDRVFYFTNYKFEVTKKKGRTPSFTFNWKQTNPYREKFNFLKKETDNLVTEDSSPVTAGSGYELYVPEKQSTMVDILKLWRQNKFSLNAKDKPLDHKKIQFLKFNGEDYIILVNALPKFHKLLNEAKDYKDLKDPFFTEVIAELQKAGSKLPILAFYDFLKPLPGTSGSAAYENFYNGRFLLFQSFKHDFFGKFPELYNFKELNIVYDAIIS